LGLKQRWPEMIGSNQLPPGEIGADVLSFCAKLCAERTPQFVPVRPEAEARLFDCFPNVEAKVKRDGGRSVVGWEISEVQGIYLEAQFHCVWQSPGGDLVDITPEEFQQAQILFLEDTRRTYTGPKVAHERFALADPQLVDQMWFLADRIRSKNEMLIAQGYPHRHPIFVQEIRPLLIRHEEIRRQIQKGRPTIPSSYRG